MLNQIREWYQYHIPHIYSPQFPRFVGDSANFVRYILTDDTAFSISFKHDIRTAYAIPDNGTICLPTWPLSPQGMQAAYPELEECPLQDFSAQAIGIINGLLIHETWHLKETASANVQWIMAGEPAHKKLFQIALNLVEDVYINDVIARTTAYAFFVEFANSIAGFLLPPALEKYAIAVETQAGILEALIPVLAHYTNVWNSADPLWDNFREYTDIMDKVIGVSNTRERGKISLELYHKLLELAEETGENPNDMPAPEEEDAGLESLPEQAMHALSRMSYKISEEFTARCKKEDKFENIPPTQEIDVNSNYHPRKKVDPDNKFAQVGRILKLLRSKRYTPGIPRETGSKILPARLWRVDLDQKVFGLPRPVEKSDRDEVILLLDYSGSIGSSFRHRIAKAALGTAYSLRQANIRFMIFAHTGYRKPEVFRIASYRMHGTTDLATALSRSLEIDANYTYEGFAVEHVGQYFTRGTHNKTLILLNDGNPEGFNYDGDPAEEHTANAARRLRQKGIRVLAMSLVSNVIPSNIRIYGKENHVDATHDVNEALRDTLLTCI